jgi:hypothetical protein
LVAHETTSFHPDGRGQRPARTDHGAQLVELGVAVALSEEDEEAGVSDWAVADWVLLDVAVLGVAVAEPLGRPVVAAPVELGLALSEPALAEPEVAVLVS